MQDKLSLVDIVASDIFYNTYIVVLLVLNALIKY